jgi:hypothetical protein
LGALASSAEAGDPKRFAARRTTRAMLNNAMVGFFMLTAPWTIE